MGNSYPSSRAKEAIEGMAEVLRSKSREVGRKVALRVAGRVAGKVRDQVIRQVGRSDWPPLNPDYKKWKRRNSLDTRMLRATGEYVNSIVPRLDEENSQFVVAPANRIHKHPIYEGQDATLDQIGVWLEYGTVNADGTPRMPARPHWRPVVKDVNQNLDSHIREFSKDYWENIVPLLVDKLRDLGIEAHLP